MEVFWWYRLYIRVWKWANITHRLICGEPKVKP
jgi:hypothetical protein